MIKNISFISLLLLTFNMIGQNDNLFDRLSAIKNNGVTFYNVDGVDIYYQKFSGAFTEKNLKKIYRKYSIKKNELKIKDEVIDFENLKTTKVDVVSESISSVNVYYFLGNSHNEVEVISFSYINFDNQKLEHQIIPLIINDKIPEACFVSGRTDKVNFAGRDLNLANCYWAGINNIQCPYNGQMSWSIHETKESADSANIDKFSVTKSKKNGKVISEEEVDVVFEEVLTKAKKVTFDLNGASSLIAGGKFLTIYYVSEKIRNNYVNCVFSFWNNDNLTPKGLTSLVEEVMQIP